jgi:hypothetical protein
MSLSRRTGSRFVPVAALVALITWQPTAALGWGEESRFSAQLSSFEEVPTLSTPGHGTLQLRLSPSSISYELSYADLTSTATVAHLHLGRPAIAGGVIAFLCGGGNKPACPASGTVRGTIVASDVLGPAAQGLAPGDLAAVERALRAGAVYANVHSTMFAEGEIRGQLRGSGDDDDD